MNATLRVLVIDDEPLARQRMVTLLSRLQPAVQVVALLAHAGEAQGWLESHTGQADVALLDVEMPGPDGLQLASHWRSRPGTPLVVFVTAHTDHALAAFDLHASDYLTKPVRLERLADAMARCRQRLAAGPSPHASKADGPDLLVHERDRLLRVPGRDVLYLKAERKHVVLRTAIGSHVLDESLTELEARLGPAVVRVHRNALVARSAMCALERRTDTEGLEGWAVRVRITDEWLPVSRRQVGAVKEELASAALRL